MARTRTSVAMFPYIKEEVIAALKDSKSRIEASLKTYEEELAQWKENVVPRFAEFVAAFNPDGNDYRRTNHIRMDEWAPPVANVVCNDSRIGRINRSIARIGMMAETDGVIKLRRDDEIFNDIGLGECL